MATGSLSDRRPCQALRRLAATLRTRRFWLRFLLACVVSLAVEHGWEYLMALAEGERPVSSSLTDLGLIYQRIVTAGPRRTQPRYTAIVDISPDPERRSVSLSNVCEQRAFLAQLITAIARSGPSVIAIDKYFQTGSCVSEDKGTPALITTIKQVSAKIPVIVGFVVN